MKLILNEEAESFPHIQKMAHNQGEIPCIMRSYIYPCMNFQIEITLFISSVHKRIHICVA